MRTHRLAAFAVALPLSACTGFSVEGTPEDEGSSSTTEAVGEVDADGDGTDSSDVTGSETGAFDCGEIHDEGACVAAGCLPLEVLPLVIDDDDATNACQIGESVVLCTPAEESNACDEEARVCADQYTWVMPLPDGGAFIAHVDVSCDLPDTFQPCPADPGDPTGATATSGAETTDGDGSEDPVAAACECACA